MDAARERLWSKFEALGKEARTIAELLSVPLRILKTQQLASCAKDAGLRNAGGQPFTVTDVRFHARSLAQQGLAKEFRSGYKCAEQVRDLIAREAVRSGRFGELIKIVDRYLKVAPAKWDTFFRYHKFTKAEMREGVRIALLQDDFKMLDRVTDAWDASHS